ncbi:deoxycytidylate deaminase [Halictus rubicundus]|uniref:deoxycytidylate deaminase n=1 Tax=Halictus rubicundus TaxID=77578 RepID=UPI00403578E7
MSENNTVIETKQNVCSKRTDYIDWDEYFMAVAFLAAKRSKDPSTQVGACIVNNERKIVGVGYNGMPTGCSDDDFPWTKDSSNRLETKYPYVCHAELNAILNKNNSSVKDCTIYVALFPCNECAKVIIQSGIKTVLYMSDKHAKKDETIAAKRLFDATGVKYRKYTPKHDRIVIDFKKIDWDVMTQSPATPLKHNELTQLPSTPVKNDGTPQLPSTPVKCNE